jgi:hypothetical protein
MPSKLFVLIAVAWVTVAAQATQDQNVNKQATDIDAKLKNMASMFEQMKGSFPHPSFFCGLIHIEIHGHMQLLCLVVCRVV